MDYKLIVIRAGIMLIFGISLSIYLYGAGFMKEKNRKRLHANSFLSLAIPLLSVAAYGGEPALRAALTFSVFSFFICLLVVDWFDIKDRSFLLINITIIVLSILTAAAAIETFKLSSGIYIIYVVNALSILLIMVLALRHRKDKGNEIIYLRGIVIFLLATISLCLYFYEYAVYVSLVLFIIGEFNMYGYFHEHNYKKIYSKIDEAEKLRASLEKDLNYEIKKRMFDIERSNERLIEISKTDALTKAYNKNAILNIIDKLASTKNAKIFSILMFDVDHFKQINDKLGHITGDICLKNMANIAFANIRSVDYLGRYGGDEFIIVLPTLGLNDAKFVAERFRVRVAETTNPNFTVSIGVASFPEDGTNAKELLAAADEGLYKSKAKGRNALSHKDLF